MDVRGERLVLATEGGQAVREIGGAPRGVGERAEFVAQVFVVGRPCDDDRKAAARRPPS